MKKRIALLFALLILVSFVGTAYANESFGLTMKNPVDAIEIREQGPSLLLRIKRAEIKECPQSPWELKRAGKVIDHPQLKHYMWESERPPFGEYDKVTLHRIVKNKIKKKRSLKKKVIFIIPGSWDSCGWSTLTDVNANTAIYLAKNGYDVYSMAFRTSYLPNNEYEQFSEFGVDISGVGGWTYGVFRDDMKACVDKIKLITKADTIFMGGFSRGSFLMYIYASEFQDDLKGLVTFDGWIKKYPPRADQAIDEATFNAIVDLLKVGNLPVSDSCQGITCPPKGTYYQLLSESTYYDYDNWQLAGVVPNALDLVGGALPGEFSVISEYVADGAHSMWGDGIFSNYYGALSDLETLINTMAEFSRYWPKIQDFETWQLDAQDDVPYLEYDDNEINLPAIGFLTDLLCPDGICLDDSIPNRTVHQDVTVNYLPDYGHLDIMIGKDSIVDIKEPLLQWLEDHK